MEEKVLTTIVKALSSGINATQELGGRLSAETDDLWDMHVRFPFAVVCMDALEQVPTFEEGPGLPCVSDGGR